MIIANAHKHTPVSNEDTGLVVARRRGLCKSQMIHLRRRCGPFAFDSCFESRMGASRLLSFLVLVLISDRTGTATSPWLVDPTTNREYSLVASKGKRFTRCEAACRALGASMPCIRSRGESNFVRKEVVAGDDFWIGLYQKSLCTWKWTSSECESNDFEDWSLGQPNNIQHVKDSGENCARHGGDGWYDTSCKETELSCVCERDLTTSTAFMNWKGPTMQFGTQGRRGGRDPLYAWAIALGCAGAVGGIFFLFLSSNCADKYGRSFPAFLIALAQGLVPGCLLLMASFLGSDDANCNDDPLPFELAGYVLLGLFFFALFAAAAWSARAKMRDARALAKSEKRSLARRDTMHSQRAVEPEADAADSTAYVNHVAENLRWVEDGITGNVLDIDEQTILIGVDTTGASVKRYESTNRRILACLFLYLPYLLTIHFLLFSRLVWDGISMEPKWVFFTLFVYCSLLLYWIPLQIGINGYVLRINDNGSRQIRVRSIADNSSFVEGSVTDRDRLWCDLELEDGTSADLLTWFVSNYKSKELLVPQAILVGQSRPEFTSVENVEELLNLMLEQGDSCPPILIRAKAGTGKTWSARQLVRKLAVDQGQKLLYAERTVPLLIYVQEFVRELRAEGGQDISHLMKEKSLVELHINMKYRNHPEWEKVLLDAFRRRHLLVVLDGVDEAADLSSLIEKFVFDQLVDEGHRVVVTSRYEGVRLDERYTDFVVMDLNPLSEEQQRKVIHNQLGENEHFDHLMTFSRIRSEHDRIYESEAFPRKRDRQDVESIAAPDKFYLEGKTEFDPAMRLHSHDARNVAGEIKSDFLTNATENILNPLLLNGLQARLEELRDGADDNEIDEEVKNLLPTPLPTDDESKQKKKWLEKLAKLSRKTRKKPAELWREIIERTDAIYVIAEKLEQPFLKAVKALLRECNINTDSALTIGNLKDPIRSHEKAIDDYGGRFKDSALPESCLPDVIRFRAMFAHSNDLDEFRERLQNGFEVDIDGDCAKLDLIRIKNKFKDLDPTHFRNALFNLRLSYREQMFLGEIQLHHEKIIGHNEESNAHHHYNYFRSLLKETYDDELSQQLDFLLETTMSVFEEVVKVPVLLSMLAVVLRSEADGAVMKLPTDIFNLYSSATATVVKEAAPKYEEDALSDSDIFACLRTLGYQNHLLHQRIFTSENALQSLHGSPSLLASWKALLRHHEVPPLLKVLTAADVAGGSGEYQFAHMSFQEFFFLETLNRSEGQLPEDFKWETIEDKVEFFRDKFNDNVTRLGGAILAQKLFSAEHGTDLAFEQCFPNANQAARLCRVLSSPGHEIKKLTITGCSLDDRCLELLGRGLALGVSKVKTLDLRGNGLDDYQLERLLSNGLLHGNLEELVLSSNLICGNGIDVFVRELEKSKNIKMLDLRDNLLCGLVNNTRTFDAVSFEARDKLRAVAAKKRFKLMLWFPLSSKRLTMFLVATFASGGVVIGIWGGFFLIFPILFVIVRALHFAFEFLRGVLRPLLMHSADAPLWLPDRPAVEHPLFVYGKLLHLILYPVTWLISLPCYIITGIESRSPLFFIIVVALGFWAPFVMVVFDVVLLFANYDIRQKALDIIDSSGAAIFAASPTQTALQNLSRFGPRTTYWSMLLLGAVPSGGTDEFQASDPACIDCFYGGTSALGRAFVRGEARTVAVMLFCAPKIELTGGCWRMHNIYNRDDLMRWIGEQVKVVTHVEDLQQVMQARSSVMPVLTKTEEARGVELRSVAPV